MKAKDFADLTWHEIGAEFWLLKLAAVLQQICVGQGLGQVELDW